MFGALGSAGWVRVVPSQKRAPLDFQFEFPVGAKCFAASHVRHSAVGTLGVSCLQAERLNLAPALVLRRSRKNSSGRCMNQIRSTSRPNHSFNSDAVAGVFRFLQHSPGYRAG